MAESTQALPGQVVSPRGRRIDMDGRVCVVAADRIEVRPPRGSAAVPVAGLPVGFLCFAAVIVWADSLPFPLLVLLLLAAVAILPISGMGFVYSAVGANVVMEKKKQSVVWQQGLLGMGVGTRELVPFWKIERLAVTETVPRDQRGLAQDVAQYEVTLLKSSGRRLTLGAVTVPRSLAADGLARARAVAGAGGGEGGGGGGGGEGGGGARAEKPGEGPEPGGSRRRRAPRRRRPEAAR